MAEHVDENVAAPDENSYKTAKRELLWKTEAEDELSIPSMTTDHIKNCIIWLLEESTNLNTDTKDGIYVTMWISLFTRELKQRNIDVKLKATFED